MKKVLIIGGGASGMMAAIMAAINNANVSIYEKNDRVGKKILVTGNGKCNLTNLSFDLSMYNSTNKESLQKYFLQFDEKSTVKTFNSFGLLLKDKNGYIYPNAEQASVVLDVLRHMLDILSVNVFTECGVLDVKPLKEGFEVVSTKGKDIFDSVIVATGSRAGLSAKDKSYKGLEGYEIGKRIGHSVIDVLPALVQVECEENFFKAVSGVRTECNITLYNEERAVMREFGELQLTDYGISGIPVFQLSSEISKRLNRNEKLYCVIDFLPQFDEDSFEEYFANRIKEHIGRTIEELFLGVLKKKLCSLIIKLSGMKPETIICDENMTAVYQALLMMKQFVVTVKGTKGYENAQVCCGGIPLSELDEHLCSKLQDNLYFCGEVVDVDGRCGGYNLQWAWTSGAIAGESSSR